jgi:hypothetical protein
MEENAVELIDYLRVIWKRKILIIVVTLVCIGVGAGVGAMKPETKRSVTYCTEAVVNIGKKVKLVPSSGVTPKVDYIESPRNLVERIPLAYGFKVDEALGYQFDVKQIGQLAMIRLTMRGPDRGVERSLKEIVDNLIDEHRIKAKGYVIVYKNFMKGLEMELEDLKKDIVELDEGIKEMKRKSGEYLINIDPITKGDEVVGDRSAFLNMLYLKTIDKESELDKRQGNLRSIQMQLTIHRITLGNLEEYKTEMVGEMKNVVIEAPKQEEERIYDAIPVAGVAGLIMSLFIAFFKEYLEESKSSRKGK